MQAGRLHHKPDNLRGLSYSVTCGRQARLPNRRLSMRTTWTFHTAGQFLFGRDAVRQLGEVATRLGARRILVVTDAVLTRAGIADRVREPLAASGIMLEAFPEGEPEPSMK